MVAAAHELLGAGQAAAVRARPRARANSTVTLYTVESVKRNVSTWVAVDGGMSDNLRPMLYGAGYEALIAQRPLRAGTRALQARGQALRVRRRDCARHPLPDPAPGDVIATPVTGATGSRWPTTTTASRAPVIFCSEGTARVVVRRETHEDLAARDVD